MSLWKDKNTKTWKYKFQRNGKNYGGGGHKTRKEAMAAQAQRRIEVFSILENEEENNNQKLFKEKYRELYNNPNISIAHIFDSIMKDLNLPPRFKDLKRVLGNGPGKTKIPATLRMKILERDNFTCKLCGGKPPDVSLTIDHILAFSLGGITDERNLQTLCQQCNFGKSDKPFFVDDLIPVAGAGGMYGNNTHQRAVIGAVDIPEIIEKTY